MEWLAQHMWPAGFPIYWRIQHYKNMMSMWCEDDEDSMLRRDRWNNTCKPHLSLRTFQPLQCEFTHVSGLGCGSGNVALEIFWKLVCYNKNLPHPRKSSLKGDSHMLVVINYEMRILGRPWLTHLIKTSVLNWNMLDNFKMSYLVDTEFP